MFRTFIPTSGFLALCLLALGCNQPSETSPIAKATDARFLLTAEPTPAIGVLDFKEHAKSGENVAVMGRVGGGINPWIEGRSAFLLVDDGAPLPCADDECGPDCPHCAQEIKESSAMVKFVDAQGKTLPIDSRDLLGVKDEETVVVQGIARRDEAGNVALMATGIYIKR